MQGELTPSQLLEKLGLGGVLKSRVKDLSGGQKRRLQLFIVLMDEPNVLILDEPTNDMDTDMLAAMEDLLDQWPGTLIVISHDRYFTERVTDYQYAVLGGHIRHLPGGVDEYFALQQREGAAPRHAQKQEAPTEDASGLSPAEHRRITKEVQAVTRKLERIDSEVARLDSTIAEHDQSDFEGLAELSASRNELLEEKDELELQWLELSEQLE